MTLIAGVVAVVTLYLLLQLFRAANPVVVARGLKIGGGIVALAAAAFVGIRGELAVAIPLGIFGAGLLGWSPFGPAGFTARTQRSSGRTSQVRSQFLEMMLDHDSGMLTGQITAGEQKGRSLHEFDLNQLVRLGATFDPESRALLESYLDRRFAGWREDAHDDRTGWDTGHVHRAPSGKMTEEEAYQILGLQPGAGPDDISRAHRSLMKKLHPDQGGSTYLASRVNEAKDTLLRRHRT